jgi:hypothetical protein
MTDKWIDAITAVETTGDRKPLITLLRSGQRPPAMVCDWLAELLSGYIPPTGLELRVLEATLEYRERGRKPGESRDAAIDRLALEYSCNRDRLDRCVRSSGKGLLAFRRRLNIP